jgi:hypothetical protein
MNKDIIDLLSDDDDPDDDNIINKIPNIKPISVKPPNKKMAHKQYRTLLDQKVQPRFKPPKPPIPKDKLTPHVTQRIKQISAARIDNSKGSYNNPLKMLGSQISTDNELIPKHFGPLLGPLKPLVLKAIRGYQTAKKVATERMYADTINKLHEKAAKVAADAIRDQIDADVMQKIIGEQIASLDKSKKDIAVPSVFTEDTMAVAQKMLADKHRDITVDDI